MNELASQLLFQLTLASAFLAVGALLATALLALLHCRLPRIHGLVWWIVLAQAVFVFQIPVAIPWNAAQVSKPLNASGSTDVQVLGLGAALGDATNTASSTAVVAGSTESHWAELLLFVWVGGLVWLLTSWAFR